MVPVAVSEWACSSGTGERLATIVGNLGPTHINVDSPKRAQGSANSFLVECVLLCLHWMLCSPFTVQRLLILKRYVVLGLDRKEKSQTAK